jgi:anti-sigma factor RsiW
MSCPDKQILSMYIDGELPSPWKEKAEEHIQNCTACADTVRAYRETQQVLAGAGTGSVGARERVWQRLVADGIAGNGGIAGSQRRQQRRSVWRRRVNVPVLAVASAAGVVAVLAVTVLVMALNQAPAAPESVAAGPFGIDLGLPAETPVVSSMSDVLRYMNSEGGYGYSMIQLP